MKTFTDLTTAIEKNDVENFMISAIVDHKNSDLYNIASTAYEYLCKKNTTINQYRNLLYTMSGEAVPDNYSANYKFTNAFFPFFVNQENAHLLGSGVTFNKSDTKDKLGGAMFDNAILKAGKAAIWGGVSFGFFNVDHIEVFKVTEFVPIWDEETGALMAGIRFWQIADNKPLRMTLYEIEGFTEYIKDNDGVRILQDKRQYQTTVSISSIGIDILDGKNYPSLPVVPLWANDEKQSEFVGLQEKIDGYDLIQSGFANDLDDASQIYWTITNAGGMDDIDLVKFVERMKVVKAAVVDDNGSTAEAHTLDVPYAARTQLLADLRDSLYRDAMALDTDKISAGNITATAIKASYENLTYKCDEFESCVTDFIHGLLALIGVDDSPTYQRSKITNMQEDTQMVLSSAQYLDDETILKHLPFINPDEIESILGKLTAEESARFEPVPIENTETEPATPEE